MLKKYLRDPLLHFLLIGSLIFAYYYYVNKDIESEESYDITIDESDVQRLATTYKMNWNTNPDSSTLSSLINDDIQSEIFYREAKRLNLQHNDEIIRRRLRQKYEFLIKDVIDSVEPSEDEIRQYYQKNVSKYSTKKTVSFKHIYFKTKKRDSDIKKLQALLNRIESNSNFNKGLGDSFHINLIQKNKTEQYLAQAFGHQFTKEVFQQDKIGWMETFVPSGFGYHLVHIDEIIKPQVIEYDEVRNQVLLDIKDHQRKIYNNQFYESLKSKYNIEILKS